MLSWPANWTCVNSLSAGLFNTTLARRRLYPVVNYGTWERRGVGWWWRRHASVGRAADLGIGYVLFRSPGNPARSNAMSELDVLGCVS